MNTPHALMTTLNTHLPSAWRAHVEALTGEILNVDTPLRVILLGAFSVGKTSLVNRLIGENLLQTACEETTALPTFIEYGPTRTMQLIGNDASVLPLDADGLARATTDAPEGAACAVLALPLDWLQGITLIDLPGLGGLSARHRDYIAAQIQQADAVLYLLAPRGPDAADMATLREIDRYGKRVKLLITRWDEIESAVAQGEQRPDLTRWSNQIEAKTGIRARLAPTDHHGLGRDDIVTFLARARDEREKVRLHRTCAELRPLLENALGQNADAQRVSATQSEQDVRTLQSELLQRRTDLTELKSFHFERAQKARESLTRKAQDIVYQGSQYLDNTLTSLTDTVQNESDWDSFAEKGSETLRLALDTVAKGLSELSAEHGGMDFPDIQIKALNLRLPPPEPVKAEDFLDMARMTQVQHKLDAQAAEIKTQQAHLAALPEHDLTESQHQLRQLLMQRDQVASQPLPRTLEQIESNNAGQILGRMVGEVGDIGLMFINPTWVGAKVASYAGKASKIARTTANAKKVADNVSNTVKMAQTLQSGAKTSNMLPPQIADKLNMLEGLSLGYWGERIGTALGGRPEEVSVIDPEAQAQQQATLDEIDAQAREMRTQLGNYEDIAHERQLTGWALEQNQKEQAHLQAKLSELQQRAEERCQAYEQSLREEHQQKLHRHIERALAHWRQDFNQQAGHMVDLLEVRVRDNWDSEIQALINERLSELDDMHARIESAPAERKAALEVLNAEAEGLRAALLALE